jgi:hypothetical protein
MLFQVCLNGTGIIGYNIMEVAKIKAQIIKTKHPDHKVTVEWSSWYEGSKSKPFYHTMEVDHHGDFKKVVSQ